MYSLLLRTTYVVKMSLNTSLKLFHLQLTKEKEHGKLNPRPGKVSLLGDLHKIYTKITLTALISLLHSEINDHQ